MIDNNQYYFSSKNRLKLKRQVYIALEKLKSNHTLHDVITILKYIGQGRYGQIQKCVIDENDHIFAMKQIPNIDHLSLQEIEKELNENNMMLSTTAEIMEIKINKNLAKLIESQICPHFALYYAYTIAPCTLKENLKNRHKNIDNCLNILSEYGDMNLTEWISNREIMKTFEDWICLFFQIIYTLGCIQRNFYILHNDLSADNILIKQLHHSSGHWIYNVNDKKYYIPNRGFVVLLIDFGLASIEDKNDLDELYDIHFLIHHIEFLIKENEYLFEHTFFIEQIKLFLKVLKEQKDLKEIFSFYQNFYNNENITNSLLEEYTCSFSNSN